MRKLFSYQVVAQTEEELFTVLDRGGVIAGMSAGAAVMGSNMPIGDTSGLASRISGREWYRHGFGFVSECYCW